MKILLAVLIAAVLILGGFLLWLARRYREVNPGLRPLGWLISAFTRYDSPEGLRRFARLANRAMPILFRPGSRKMDAERVTIRGRDGNEIPIVVYRPKGHAGGGVGLLWIHGGGYAIGTPGGEKSFLAPLVRAANTVAIVPDYRKSVEAPYPAAFHDCRDALLWMRDNAERLGIRSDQLFVGGASAGGGLTAAVALWARDTREVNIAFQMPIYPMINDRMDTPSMIGNKGFLWDEKRNRAAWRVYLGEMDSSDAVPAYAAPLRAADFSGLPPAYTFVGKLDPFYDETRAYIQALRDAGVPAERDEYAGAFHGFDVIPCRISREARGKLLEAYRRAAETRFAKQGD